MPTELNRAIRNTITIAQNEWKYVALIQTNFDPDLPSVKVLPSEFNQVILNIIVNAAHAIAVHQQKENNASQGTIVISTLVSGNSVEIRLSVYPKEHQKEIFDPFFTTKEVGKGAGQGLVIAYSVIAEGHQGSIKVESGPGKGTAIIIRIPLADDKTSIECELPVLKQQVS